MGRVIQVRRVYGSKVGSPFLLDTHPNIDTRHGKTEARKKIIDVLKRCHYEKIKGLTMPGAWWAFERKLFRTFRQSNTRVSIVGIEKQKHLFTMAALYMSKQNKPLKIKHSEEVDGHAVSNGKDRVLINGDIHKYIDAPNERNQRYNFIWLDLQGPISERLVKSLQGLRKWISKNAIVAVTVSVGRESLKTTRRINGDRLKYLSVDIPALLGGEVIDTYRYSDGATMIQTIYQIENEV